MSSLKQYINIYIYMVEKYDCTSYNFFFFFAEVIFYIVYTLYTFVCKNKNVRAMLLFKSYNISQNIAKV